jgi:hypothetical protein
VYVYLDDSLQLGLDCVAMLSPTQAVVYGWAMTPRGVGTDLAVVAGLEGECAIGHCSFHPRKDVVPADPRAAEVNGFTLVVEVPEDAPALELTLAAGALLLRADMLDARVETDLFKATADRSWSATFALLRDALSTPALTSLLRYQGRPFGAFAEWLARMPVLRGRAQGIVNFAEAEALSAPSGEVLAMLRAPGLLPREASVDAIALGWLRAGDGLVEPALLPLADLHTARLPAALGCYARLSPAVLDRLQGVELLVQAVPRQGEAAWLRCQPASVTVPELLDGACRTIPEHLALPVEAAGAVGLEMLRQVIARREAAFGPTLHALASPDAAGGSGLPRLALLLGADDPSAARLFHVAAQEFERRCDTVLVMGTAAEDVVQAFARRGRIATLAGIAAAEALREAAGRAGVLAVEASAFAEAVIAGRPGDAFAHPLSPGDTARLLSLHAVAGCATPLADSLQRLLRARREGVADSRFRPVQRPWSNRHAGELVNAHLQRLWAAGTTSAAPGAVPEPAHA